jgi:hypothetical protein
MTRKITRTAVTIAPTIQSSTLLKEEGVAEEADLTVTVTFCSATLPTLSWTRRLAV